MKNLYKSAISVLCILLISVCLPSRVNTVNCLNNSLLFQSDYESINQTKTPFYEQINYIQMLSLHQESKRIVSDKKELMLSMEQKKKAANKDINKEVNKDVKKDINNDVRKSNKKDVGIDGDKEVGTSEDNKLTLVSVGDDLIHTGIIQRASLENGTYNFDFLFKNVLDEIKTADVAMINQETILCDSSLGYTGYPLFGSPYAVGQAAEKAGFDVILHATNHTLDKGVKGITETIEFWEKYNNIDVAGIHESEKLEERVVIREVKGIKLAILNYTYGMNGLVLPKDKGYMVSLLSNRKQMKEDIRYAKKHADFVIVCPHWGTEYVYEPNKQQKDLAQFFADEEVDLVIGTHPHVLQPVKWLKNSKGTHKTLVYYSLGNFVSSQDKVPRLLGGMAKVELIRKNGQVVIKHAEIKPIVTHMEYGTKYRYGTYLLEDYTDQLARKHDFNQKNRGSVSVAKFENLSSDILGKWFKKK